MCSRLVIGGAVGSYRAKVVVTTKDGEADPIQTICRGTAGDTPTPHLFVLVVDYILRHARQYSRLYHQSTCGYLITYIVPHISVSDLDFANDIALLSHNHVDGQVLLTAVEQEALPILV